MDIIKYSLALCLFVGQIFAAAVPARARLTPCRKLTGDEFILTRCHPYLGGSRSPGDSIGMTGFEFQANGGCEKRIYVDDSFQVHVDWMKTPYPYQSMAWRRMEWNFRYNDGSYFGELDASFYTSGYGSLDLTQDVDIAMQRTVISYHYNYGSNAYYPTYDVDAGNGAGAFPNNPKYFGANNSLWPMVAVSKNGNIILATDDIAGNFHHCYVSTDNGTTWTNPFNSDSCATISMFVMASRMSNKVAFVETRYKNDSLAQGQLDNNVFYRLSNDGGVGWSPRVNITNYADNDSFRAYCCVSCIFDQNDNLHIVWAGRKYTNGIPYDASKILHWDEVHDSITVVSRSTGIFEGGWWGCTNPNGYGAWRMPADEPLMAVDRSTGTLYTFWCGQDDTSDISLGGYPNGDIYCALSFDGGLTWDSWRNLTDTHTPGAPAGACEDEDYIAVCPYISRDSIFLTYIEDKDAGAVNCGEGDTTNNPVRIYVFYAPHKIDESMTDAPRSPLLHTSPNPVHGSASLQYYLPKEGEISLKLFDISGQLVKIVDEGLKNAGDYQARVDFINLPSGTYFVVLSMTGKRMTEKMVVVK